MTALPTEPAYRLDERVSDRRQERPAVSKMNTAHRRPAVAAAVRQRMAALKITTAELSRKIDMSEATIRRIRAGTASPHPGTLIRLSKGLGWPGGYLKDVAAGNAYLPTHGLMTPDVISRIDARLARVESKLDKLMRLADSATQRNERRSAQQKAHT